MHLNSMQASDIAFGALGTDIEIAPSLDGVYQKCALSQGYVHRAPLDQGQ